MRIKACNSAALAAIYPARETCWIQLYFPPPAIGLINQDCLNPSVTAWAVILPTTLYREGASKAIAAQKRGKRPPPPLAALSGKVEPELTPRLRPEERRRDEEKEKQRFFCGK
jgi:hypothetical protein